MTSRKKRNTAKETVGKAAGKNRATRPEQAMFVLRVFLGIVFICAAAYRALHYDAAVREMTALALPTPLIIPIILLEAGIGATLIAGWRTRHVAIITTLFLISAISASIIATGPAIITSAGELFVFDPTPTDIFLHGTYMVIALTIAMRYRNN
ncbi:TPA: DoxX family membrane protein [Candidatus Woesearchaeota archaeon]|nr:DoxX family membrane protein [Candidatus Woesearchaeota archaeon]